MKKLFKVSTKAAIFDSAHEHIVVIHMDQFNDQGLYNNWGLPGGHIDEDEMPDAAISREILEECGIKPNYLMRKDFFVHSDGKLVLAYVGEVSDTVLESQQGNLEGVPKWITLAEFKTIQIEPRYREFVLENWPK